MDSIRIRTGAQKSRISRNQLLSLEIWSILWIVEKTKLCGVGGKMDG
jgi:hypothetical protein